MKIKWNKTESSRANKVFLQVMFMGGDADTEHPEEYELPQSFSKNFVLTDESLKIIEDFKTLKSILEDEDNDYDSVMEEYGEDMARSYENVPNDPQSDYSTKCYLDDITLIGYDVEGNKFESYII